MGIPLIHTLTVTDTESEDLLERGNHYEKEIRLSDRGLHNAGSVCADGLCHEDRKGDIEHGKYQRRDAARHDKKH